MLVSHLENIKSKKNTSPYLIFALKPALILLKFAVLYGLWPLQVFQYHDKEIFLIIQILKKGNARYSKDSPMNDQLFFSKNKLSWTSYQMGNPENSKCNNIFT